MSKSSTTTRKRRNPDWIHHPHPEEILLEDFMKPLGMSQNALARSLKVSPRRINEPVHGKRAVSADTDLRLGRYFNLHEGFFLGLQWISTSWSRSASSASGSTRSLPTRGNPA